MKYIFFLFLILCTTITECPSAIIFQTHATIKPDGTITQQAFSRKFLETTFNKGTSLQELVNTLKNKTFERTAGFPAPEHIPTRHIIDIEAATISIYAEITTEENRQNLARLLHEYDTSN